MRKSFTMIELVMVIVILAILAAVAIPRYIDLQVQANASAETGVVGGVRAGIATSYIETCAAGACVWPAALDVAGVGDCTVANACFDLILEQGGLTDGAWAVDAAGDYTGPAGGVYAYDNTDGSFE